MSEIFEPEPENIVWNKDKETSDAYIKNIGIGQKPLRVGYLDEPDNRLNYDFVALDKIVDDKNNGEVPLTSIDARKIDYPVKIEDKDVLKRLNEPKLAFVPETNNKDAYPLSFLSIKEGEVDKGKNWYLQNDPKLPDDIAELMARYSFGDLKHMTKKEAKNRRKKLAKKGKTIYEDNKLSVKKGKFIVDLS